MSKYTAEEPTITLELTVEEAAMVAGLAYTADLATVQRGLYVAMGTHVVGGELFAEVRKRVQDAMPAAWVWSKAHDALKDIEALPAETPVPYFTVEAVSYYGGYGGVRSAMSDGAFNKTREPDRFPTRKAAERAFGAWALTHFGASASTFCVVEHKDEPRPARFVRRGS